MEEREGLTCRWIEREVLYREAVALGLAERDPVVKTQLVRAMTHLLRNSAAVEEPTEEALQAWITEDLDRYGVPARWSLELVAPPERGRFLDTPRADLTRRALESGEPASVDPAWRTFARHRPRRTLIATYGASFAAPWPPPRCRRGVWVDHARPHRLSRQRRRPRPQPSPSVRCASGLERTGYAPASQLMYRTPSPVSRKATRSPCRRKPGRWSSQRPGDREDPRGGGSMTPARERARTPAFAPAPWRRTLAWLMTSLCAWACICAAASRPAKAHDFRPAVLAIKQVEPGSYVTRWSPPRLSPGQTAVSPRFPDPCEIDGARLCGPSGLTAPITFEGLAGTNIEVVVMFAGLDGETQTRVVTGDAPQVQFTLGTMRRAASPGSTPPSASSTSSRDLTTCSS